MFNLIFNGNISFNLLYLPAVWIPLTLLCIATTWAIATIGVYIKDIENVVSPSVTCDVCKPNFLFIRDGARKYKVDNENKSTNNIYRRD